MFLWAALAMFVAVTIGAFEVNTHTGCRPCYGAKKSIGMIVFLYATVLFLGALTHAPSILHPLEKLMPKQPQSALAQAVKENSFRKIHSIAELDAILSQSKGKKIMLDFYADWCTSCKELEHLTFSDTRVKKALAGYVLIQADITANSDEEKALSQKFGLFGPPALIFYDAQGKEVRSKRSIGFLPPEELLEKL
jgi:thiol:disulfide interchange protein DsbD